MVDNMNLKLKINLFFGVLLIFSSLTTTGILISNARQTVHTKIQSAMTAASHLITVVLPSTRTTNSPTVHQRMAKLVKALSEIPGIHIMVYRTGQLQYAGGLTPNNLAMPPGLLTEYLSPTIKPLITRSGGGVIVISAAPMQEISERWLDIRALLILGSGLTIFILLILYIGINRIFKPLENLSKALSSFEKGDLHLRLPKFSYKEMNHISNAFNRMGKALQSSIRDNQRLATLVKQSGDAILSLDHEGKIIFYNHAAEHIFPQLNHNLVGSSLLKLDFGQYQQKITDVIEQHKAVANLELTLPSKNRDSVELLLSISILSDVEEHATGFICTLRDITEHKQAEAAKHQLQASRLLTQHMSNMQESERRNLARELHDELGQCVTAIKTDAVLIRNRTLTRGKLPPSDSKIFNSAQAIIDVASHIYDVVHHMLTRLRPSPLDDLGLVLTLQGTISTWQKRQPNIKFNLALNGELNNLEETMNMTIFRIIQESITNAVRHAKATKIDISVTNVRYKNQLVMDVSDNGKGMEINDFYTDVDFGLLGMRERVQSLNGDFQLISAPDEGLKIHINLPITGT